MKDHSVIEEFFKLEISFVTFLLNDCECLKCLKTFVPSGKKRFWFNLLNWKKQNDRFPFTMSLTNDSQDPFTLVKLYFILPEDSKNGKSVLKICAFSIQTAELETFTTWNRLNFEILWLFSIWDNALGVNLLNKHFNAGTGVLELAVVFD